MIVETRSGHARPRTTNSKDALDIVVREYFTRHGIEDDRVDSVEGESAGARFHLLLLRMCNFFRPVHNVCMQW